MRDTVMAMNVLHAGEDGKTRFRITAWPGRPFPLEEMSVPLDDPILEGQWQYKVSREGAVIPEKQVSPDRMSAGEVYLELKDLDLSDADAILAFINSRGPLGASVRRLPPFGWVTVDRAWPWLLQDGLAGHDQVRDELASARRAAEVTSEPAVIETLTEFRHAAALLRDLTSAWRAVSEDEPMTETESLITAPALVQQDPATQEPGAFPPVAVTILSTYLTALLQPFYPRVDPVLERTSDDRPVHAARAAAPTLFWLCALELYNHIAESARYKICENQNCGRLYVRQQGRARFGQHRMTATKYCSAECARAQAQRDYRARERAKRAEGRSDLRG